MATWTSLIADGDVTQGTPKDGYFLTPTGQFMPTFCDRIHGKESPNTGDQLRVVNADLVKEGKAIALDVDTVDDCEVEPSGRLHIELSGAIVIDDKDEVYMAVEALNSGVITPGSTISLESAARAFPETNGVLYYYDGTKPIEIYYDRITCGPGEYDDCSAKLSKTQPTSFSFNLPGGVVALNSKNYKNIIIQSTGYAGDNNSTSKLITYTYPINTSSGVTQLPSVIFEIFQDLDNWVPPPGKEIIIGEGLSSLDIHQEYAQTKKELPSETEPNNSLNCVKEFTLLLDKADLMGQAWAITGYDLHYDAQTKVGWGYQVDYAVDGISFRLHFPEATSTAFSAYAISFMIYDGVDDDCIPNEIKPLYPALADLPLIVLWKQTVVEGVIYRTWLAYKIINDDDFIRGNQWPWDGQCVTDNSSILARIREDRNGTIKYNDIQIFFGDSSIKYGPLDGVLPKYFPILVEPPYYRTPNDISWDIRDFREVYYPEYSYSAAGDPDNRLTWPPVPVPSWPSNTTFDVTTRYIGEWNQTHNDYFSFIAGGTSFGARQWDGFNSAEQYTGAMADWNGTGFIVMTDNGTIRDASFTTPSSGTFPSDRYEVGLHVLGGFKANSGGTRMYFDDFALEWRDW